MQIPPRILRAEIEDIPGARPKLSPREIDRQETILAAARRVLAHHGRAAITLSGLATALCMSPASIRRFFPDMDYLLGEILRRHLLAVSRALGEAIRQAPTEGPARQAARRAAYITATRTVLGGLTEAHLLLVRERHHLPPDQLGPIEQMRDGLGEILAGEHGAAAMGLLDMPELSVAQIDAMVRCLAPLARGTLKIVQTAPTQETTQPPGLPPQTAAEGTHARAGPA